MNLRRYAPTLLGGNPEAPGQWAKLAAQGQASQEQDGGV